MSISNTSIAPVTSNVYGIDLGTTNTCIARYVNKKFEIIEIDHSPTVPSVVAFDGKDWLIGISAKNYSKIDPLNAVSSIKRQMGNANYFKEFSNIQQLPSHQSLTKGFSPVEISAKILEYVKQKAQLVIKQEVKDVVITVPAYFNDYQRRATMDAGSAAGLNVLRIINEPTAASLVYEIGETRVQESHSKIYSKHQQQNKNDHNDHKDQVKNKEEKWLVYDLGGGTFDVTIISVRESHKEVLASSGNNFLGGDDFDRKIVAYISDHIRMKYKLDVSSNPVVLAKLKHLAETAKITLSTETKAEIFDIIDIEEKKHEISLTLNRYQFEEMIKDYISSTIDKTKEVLMFANCEASEIAKLLLVGGSTRIPLVKEQLERHFSLQGQDYVDPDLSVALGACIQATISSGLNFDHIIIDVSPHTLGVAAHGELDESGSLFKNMMEKYSDDDYDDDSDDNDDDVKENESEYANSIKKIIKRHPRTFSPVIQRNSKLPAKFINTYMTMVDGQKYVEVAVYQGEAKDTKENLFIGSFLVNLTPSPAYTPINIGMEYDLNGIINISVIQNGQNIGNELGADKKSNVLSYTMNLNRPALANLDSEILRFNRDFDYKKDFDDEEDEFEHDYDSADNEGVAINNKKENKSEKRVMNLLIQRVEDRLSELNELNTLSDKSSTNNSENDEINKLLEQYREFLKEGNDDSIDNIEDQLYDWLDRSKVITNNNSLTL
ncbi:MAG: Hsp70 family protein [Oligoflexia bacterium]|nr:Hsp70 family protein [Oligoflexia bacterium]